MNVGTAFLIRRKRIRRGLEEAGAVSPETAIPLEDVGLLCPHAYRRFTERLVARGHIKRTEENRYYL